MKNGPNRPGGGVPGRNGLGPRSPGTAETTHPKNWPKRPRPKRPRAETTRIHPRIPKDTPRNPKIPIFDQLNYILIVLRVYFQLIYIFIIYKVMKYRKILMKYIFTPPECTYNFFWITSDFSINFSIDLLQCTSELQTPITFLFVNENIKCGYAFS